MTLRIVLLTKWAPSISIEIIKMTTLLSTFCRMFKFASAKYLLMNDKRERDM